MASCNPSLSAVPACFGRISLLLVCLCLLGGVDAQDRRNEVRALADFNPASASSADYADTPGTDTFVGYWSTWNESDENPCSWAGVVCSTNFTVVELVFSGWSSGPTHVQPLAGLRDLRALDMSSSFLEVIPDDIGALYGLVRLDLSRNGLGGSIPASISNCTSLQYISLEQNRLSGEIPSLRGLVNLEFINVAGNQLAGPFPKDVADLSSLVSIDFTENMLNGSIPSLSNLTNLLVLKLDDNNFAKFEDSWLPPPNLHSLSVSGNRLEGMIPPSITNMSTLVSVNMSRNQFSSVPSSFSELLYNLRSSSRRNSPQVDLSQNLLFGDILHTILPDSSSQSRIDLNLSRNNLTGNIPLNGAKTHGYASLDLSYNGLTGPVPYFFNNNETFIDILHLHHNNLSGDIVDVLNAHSKALNQISELRLQNNLFSGDLSRIAFANCSELDVSIVDLSYNNLQISTVETNPDPLRALLECFMKSGSDYPSLQEFRIAGNNFSGTVLPTYFNLLDPGGQSLAILDLSNSHLKGEISGTAFNSTWFPALQFLDLSDNDLTGPVPPNVVNLPNLATFYVANNSLQGPLPTILPSSTLYNPSFFAGNRGLCGDPLPACRQFSQTAVPWWLLFITIGGSMIIAIGSCLVAGWRWKVYQKRHEQDADLIRTLMDRESATLMALRDLKKATNNFEASAQIGEGGFGAVYVGKLSDGRRVAIKKSKREGLEKDKQQFLNEVRILSQINHRHLVKLLGCCMENQNALLVFEFISNGTLQEHLQGKFVGPHLSWDKRLVIAIQTAEALNYLHTEASFPIYHRDVKSSNILLDENFQVKVADFGISRLAPVEATHVSTVAIQGTIGYIDPEYYTSYQLNDKSDVYSFGVVLLELISAKPPIDFLRGGDETSLVNFAKPLIQGGDLQQLIDGSLLETYNDPSGYGKESILSVGQLALATLDMQSKARPSMKEVSIELQNIRIELHSKWKDLGSTNEHCSEDLNHGQMISLLESVSTWRASSSILQNSGSWIEMSQSSFSSA